jgi:hypothetical protein
MRKKLPIGIQTFREIREENHYYVDKTGFALRLITEGKHYFLSRPRRFGKSLFLDTLAELFEGNEPLFRGLYCHSRWDWSITYPVIRLNLGLRQLQSPGELCRHLNQQLLVNRQQLAVEAEDDLPAEYLRKLITAAHARYGQRVVVLVDEYDKPILDNLAEPERARAMRDQLRDVYSVLKGSDAHLKFVFLTGVSKFSKVSLFSGLNNLEDITVNRDFSALCGYTEQDMESIFGPELEGLDRTTIRRWYNGYNWTGEAVYNPFDLLLFFRNREFRPYWFETGTPTFLIELLARRQFYTPTLSHLVTSMELLSCFDVDDISCEALLWQTGYLTIQQVEEILPGHRAYTLNYPNREVEWCLNSHLLWAYGVNQSDAVQHTLRLPKLLREANLTGLEYHFKSLFASIPYNWYTQNDMARFEGYYASVFYSHLAALGLDLQPEDVTNQGRIDLSLRFEAQIYLFEFKLVERFPGVSPLQQILERGYTEKFTAEGLPVHCIGILFSEQARNVIEWEHLSIPPYTGVTDA